MIRSAIILMLLSTVAFALTPLDDTFPEGVPADAQIEEDEILTEALQSEKEGVDIALTRIIPEKAFVGEELTVTLRVENNHDDGVEILLIEPMRRGVSYVKSPEPHIMHYEALEIRLLRWVATLYSGEVIEYDYVIRLDSPGSITFPPATVNDQYGNTFESKPMLIMVECVPDGICNSGENYINCPLDCPTGSADGICDGVEDGKIDPDCVAGYDPDNQTPEKTIVETEEKKGVCNGINLALLALATTLITKMKNLPIG